MFAITFGHLMPTGMAVMEKTDIPSVGKDMVKAILVYCHWEVKRYSHKAKPFMSLPPILLC